ncbi:MAG TPA: NAD-dependent epimerase/dehydratase family protein [Bacteroidales bacterium]|nr:NAD-dependent epimerase/dehydratase family protein [Bacteroidales bacterium]
MFSVGITGQAGFIGTHLFNFLGLKKDEVTRIPFRDEYFSDTEVLENFVKQCDVIIHLAALNRHNDPQTIYDTNLLLVNKLIAAMEKTNSRPHVLFSSSTQEERDNMFGKSKREGRALFEQWAERNHARFTGLVIPNVFGPFGNPYYNSVVATFCHQLTHNEQPKIEIDATLKLIYIGDLVSLIWNEILNQSPVTNHQSPVTIPHTVEKNVTELLALVNRFKTDYFDNGQFPALHHTFERDLFNTFRCYIDIEKINPVKLKMNTDDRGTFVETIKTELGGQVSFSTTRPGITRGNHFHTRKIERFAVIKGKARIQLRRIGTDKVMDFYLDGNEPSYVDMPIWYTHNITNVGDEDVYTIFWINEFFNPDDPDTYFEAV